MPQYRVDKAGFYNGVLFSPKNPKRNVVHTEKPFPSVKGKEQVPSWLTRIEEETAAQAKARRKKEKDAADAAAKKAESDSADIAAVTFAEASGTVVEILS